MQPFYRSVVGLPSELQVVRTHPGSAPSSPPQIIAARMLNSTAAFVAWTMLGSGEQTGPLVGYQVGRKGPSGQLGQLIFIQIECMNLEQSLLRVMSIIHNSQRVVLST